MEPKEAYRVTVPYGFTEEQFYTGVSQPLLGAVWTRAGISRAYNVEKTV
jgi:hypothetical protein